MTYNKDKFMKNDFWILGISRGHNSGVCLLKNGKIVFAIEEERFSRKKYDGSPFAAMVKVKEYTDKVDYMFIAHTQNMDSAGRTDFTGDNVYVGLARKIGLIDQYEEPMKHPQVIDLSHQHHKIHAACAFYRSGFDDAVAVVVDGCGSVNNLEYVFDSKFNPQIPSHLGFWEVESVINCGYPAKFNTLYKHSGSADPLLTDVNPERSAEYLGEDGTFFSVNSRNAGITKTYEAVTKYCGFQEIEAGKTMGLFPYGKPNDKLPKLFKKVGDLTLADADVVVPFYPRGALLNAQPFSELSTHLDSHDDVTHEQNRRDMAYAVQTETQDQVLDLIIKASESAGKKKVVLSGGYALNCVANYYYLTELNKRGIELYVEPISNDGGTAIGVALLGFHSLTEISDKLNGREIYLGPQYHYTNDQINLVVKKYNASIKDATDSDVVDLMTSKNIVACFQGRSEAGPRALGNRSLMFDPTFKDGKDFVNEIKRREYFRPFAGSILKEDVHEWFDIRGLEDTPHMMYAVNCQPGIAEKIPSIIHVDGTCRIQTVDEQSNPLYYKIIKEFKNRTGVPIIFNTSFNLGGEPLVETLEDALRTLANSKIEYLYLPEYNKLITVKN
jgi:carbamoyltransferase